jgi:hypothetical protein
MDSPRTNLVQNAVVVRGAVIQGVGPIVAVNTGVSILIELRIALTLFRHLFHKEKRYLPLVPP